MKKLLLTTLIASLLLLPLGTVALADDETPTPAETEMEYVEYISGQAPAQSSVEAMAPALHAVLLALENRDQSVFTTADSSLSWEMLYNLLSMYGQLDDRSAYEGEQLVLPSETVMDYSAALFAAPLAADTMPAELSDRMTYDPASDEYYLYCGSDGLSQVVITRTEDLPGAVSVSGKLMFLAEDMELASFTATLALADNLFGYTLTEMNVE